MLVYFYELNNSTLVDVTKKCNHQVTFLQNDMICIEECFSKTSGMWVCVCFKKGRNLKDNALKVQQTQPACHSINSIFQQWSPTELSDIASAPKTEKPQPFYIHLCKIYSTFSRYLCSSLQEKWATKLKRHCCSFFFKGWQKIAFFNI